MLFKVPEEAQGIGRAGGEPKYYREGSMLSTVTPTEVRRLVVEFLARLKFAVADDAVIETLLIREGRYFGRSYRAAGVMAMWMIDIGLVQFYAADGEMLGSLSLLESAEAPQQRKAA